jgi:NADPH2:quinone reductase
MAGPVISLPAAVLRSAGLEILGMGTGTMPPMDVITGMLGELLDLLSAGKLHIDIDRIPLSAVHQAWTRDQQGRRPVLIP